MTHLYGVIGDPIAHSLSPLIHRGWIRDHNLGADYRAFHVPADILDEGLTSLTRQGVKGLNVTLPHKRAVLAQCTEYSDLVRELGAANTLSRLPSGDWRADNTDRGGFLVDFQSVSALPLAAQRVLILGAGGSAAAIAQALISAGAYPVIANRTLENARALCEQLGLPEKRAVSLELLPAIMPDVQSIVCCLAIGKGIDQLDLGGGEGRLFYDLSYGPKAEPMAEWVTDLGWCAHDGLGMLVGQAALSFEIWHGIQPDTARALRRCRDALGLLA